jgi:hypothetical protein
MRFPELIAKLELFAWPQEEIVWVAKGKTDSPSFISGKYISSPDVDCYINTIEVTYVRLMSVQLLYVKNALKWFL